MRQQVISRGDTEVANQIETLNAYYSYAWRQVIAPATTPWALGTPVPPLVSATISSWIAVSMYQGVAL